MILEIQNKVSELVWCRWIKMNTNILIIGLIGIVLVVISGCGNSTAKIELNTNSFDLGDIQPDDGIRTEVFSVKNSGTSLLTISSISTSCGCTEAEVQSKEIQPGEQTALTVTYDPLVHPGLVGKIKRMVYIQSNDILNPEIELELVGNSLPSIFGESSQGHSDDLEEFEISPFELKSKNNFKLLDVREDSEYEENHIKGTLLLSVNKINQAELDKLGLEKNDEIVVYCRSGTRSKKAYELLKTLGYTNVKSLKGGIVHWMEENFPVEKGVGSADTEFSQPENSPIITVDRKEHDFGKLPRKAGVVNTSFTITNSGESALEVSTIYTSCGCTSAIIQDLVIQQGKSTELTVFFDPDFHEEPQGRFSRTVFLETNDPANSEIELRIWVDILEGVSNE